MSHSRGSSNTVLIVVLGLTVVGIMVCCGGGYLAFVKVGEVATKVGETITKAQEEMNVTDPAKIDAVLAEIATIEIPAVFKPQKASTIPFSNAHRVIYRAQGDQRSSIGFLILSDSPGEQMFDEGDSSSDLKLEHAGPTGREGRSRKKVGSGKGHATAREEEPDEDPALPKDAEGPAGADDEAEPKAKTPAGKTPVAEKKSKGSNSKKAETAANVKFETRETNINGNNARFQIAQVLGPDQKVEKIEVFGEFRTKELRHACLKMHVTADLLNIEQVGKMLDSIR